MIDESDGVAPFKLPAIPLIKQFDENYGQVERAPATD